MKRLLLAVAIVMVTTGSSFAHGGVGFQVNLGLPLFFPFVYPTTYGYYQPPPPRVQYYRPYGPPRVIERVYDNGYRVERRIRVYDDRYGYDWRYGPYRGY